MTVEPVSSRSRRTKQPSVTIVDHYVAEKPKGSRKKADGGERLIDEGQSAEEEVDEEEEGWENESIEYDHSEYDSSSH